MSSVAESPSGTTVRDEWVDANFERGSAVRVLPIYDRSWAEGPAGGLTCHGHDRGHVTIGGSLAFTFLRTRQRQGFLRMDVEKLPAAIVQILPGDNKHEEREALLSAWGMMEMVKRKTPGKLEQLYWMDRLEGPLLWTGFLREIDPENMRRLTEIKLDLAAELFGETRKHLWKPAKGYPFARGRSQWETIEWASQMKEEGTTLLCKMGPEAEWGEVCAGVFSGTLMYAYREPETYAGYLFAYRRTGEEPVLLTCFDVR